MALRRGSRASDNFAQISNTALRDSRLTLRTRGLLALMLSYPPGWTTSADRLANGNPEGRDAIRKSLNELEQYGYLVRAKHRNEKGQWVHDQVAYDTPNNEPAAPPEDGDGTFSAPF